MARLTSHCFHCTVMLRQWALKRFHTSFLKKESLGSYFTPGKSNHALSYSFRMVSHSYFKPGAFTEKPTMNAFSNFRPFGRRSTYDACIGFYIVAMDSGSPHHYFHAPMSAFRLSGYDFTTLCTLFRYSGTAHSGVSARVLPAVWQTAVGISLFGINSVRQRNFTSELKV